MDTNQLPTSENSPNEAPTSRVDLHALIEKVNAVQEAMAQVIIGKSEVIDMILVAMLADGHILLEGLPGVAKTKMAKTIAQLMSVGFSRIQFTPDLMPSDVTGTNIFNPTTTRFEFHKGPIFSNIILIDEINRSPAKTQAALFEVMEERHITIDGVKHLMDHPFLILATQNPVEHEGTYRLPEAQLDRFLFKLNIDYPSLEEELEILKSHNEASKSKQANMLTPILTVADLDELRSLVAKVFVSDEIMQYIAQLVHQTRTHASIFLGASPRASLALLKASKAFAALQSRDFVIPEDIISIAPSILRHRIIITPEKEMEGDTNDDIIDELLKAVPVPR